MCPSWRIASADRSIWSSIDINRLYNNKIDKNGHLCWPSNQYANTLHFQYSIRQTQNRTIYTIYIALDIMLRVPLEIFTSTTAVLFIVPFCKLNKYFLWLHYLNICVKVMIVAWLGSVWLAWVNIWPDVWTRNVVIEKSCFEFVSP